MGHGESKGKTGCTQGVYVRARGFGSPGISHHKRHKMHRCRDDLGSRARGICCGKPSPRDAQLSQLRAVRDRDRAIPNSLPN